MPPKRSGTADDSSRPRTRQRAGNQNTTINASSVVFSDFNILPDMTVDAIQRFLPSNVVEEVRDTEVHLMLYRFASCASGS
jgi:hypothetical protein